MKIIHHIFKNCPKRCLILIRNMMEEIKFNIDHLNHSLYLDLLKQSWNFLIRPRIYWNFDNNTSYCVFVIYMANCSFKKNEGFPPLNLKFFLKDPSNHTGRHRVSAKDQRRVGARALSAVACGMKQTTICLSVR